MRLLYFFVLVFLISSCTKEKTQDTPKTPKPEFKVEIVSGNQQNGFINQELANPITIKVTSPEGTLYNRASIALITTDGNLISRNGFYPSGTYLVYWMLGCKEGIQNAAVIVSDSAEKPIDTIQISALVARDNPWNRVCGLPVKVEELKFNLSHVLKFIEHPGGIFYTLLISYSDYLIYSSADNGETWTETSNCTAYMHVHDLTVDANGNFFLSTDKGLFKSSDCKSWKKVIDGMMDKCFSIDNQTLFACEFLFKTIYRSDDKGETWNKTSISHINESNARWYSEGIRQIKRIDNNKILLLDDNKDLLLSKDNGTTWELFTNTNQFFHKTGFILKDNALYLVDITGGESIPKVYKSDITNVSWSLFCTLNHAPHNLDDLNKISSTIDYLYFLTSSGLYKVNQNGDTLNITNNIWSKMVNINNFLVSKQGTFLVGSDYSDGKSIFRSKLSQP
jgi:hypothetical protein